MKSSASIATLAPALVAALAEIGGVAKGKTNPHFKSQYASLESVIEASKGILASHGIALMQFPAAFSGGAMSLDTVLIHESGEWLSGEEAFGVATGKQDPQAVGSALTYARRYAQMAVLNMPAVDDDANAATFTTKPVKNPTVNVHPEGPDWWGAEGFGMSAAQAKKEGWGEKLDDWLGFIPTIPTAAEWKDWCAENAADIKRLPKGWRVMLREAAEERGVELGAIQSSTLKAA